jgi:triacylglycerol lipase
LIQLLKEAKDEEIEAVLGEDITQERIETAIENNELSPLFTGNHSWVRSATTISTPHDGTTMADAVLGAIPFAQQLIGFVGGMAGIEDEPIYDFKLDQWDLKMEDDECYIDYMDRVWSSPIWEDTKDISAWDLKPDGAKELNEWVKAQPDVYYFSWATEETRQHLITGFHVPEIGMNISLIPMALHMGSYTRNDNRVPIDETWWQNDGVVNTNSMDGPSVGAADEIVDFDGTAQEGKWNYMGKIDSTDHMEIVGLGTVWRQKDFYRDQADLLGSLPE